MDNYFQKSTKDLSLLRKILIALVGDLNKRISLKSYDEGKLKVEGIPFHFSMAGEETYLQDNFINDTSQDIGNNFLEGQYDQTPRGIVNVSGINIDNQNLTNKWTNLNLQIEEEGHLKRINALNRNIPISLSVDCKIIIDNIINSFLITEELMKEIYKTSVAYYDYLGVPVPVVYRFPFDSSREQTLDFGWNDKKQYEITFSLTVTSFILDLIEDSKRFAGNRMESINIRISDNVEK